jgi:hypothetical protein
MKKHLVIFGTDNYTNAITSLSKSSKNYFDKIHVFKSEDIDIDFKNKNSLILTQPRGFGYWLWKPYFILKVLNLVNKGDYVFYVDAGNIFLKDPTFLFEDIKTGGIILFDNRDGVLDGSASKNYISCKKDTFVLMGCDNDEYVYGTHLNASYQIYQKNENSIKFVSEYLKYCENHNIITDTPNKYGNNYMGYYDHRHDQSILSLLAIKYKIKPLVDPSEWGNKCGVRGFEQIFLHHRNPDFIL